MQMQTTEKSTTIGKSHMPGIPAEPRSRDSESPQEILATTCFFGVLFDAISFLLAKWKDTYGPFVSIYLITEQGWSQSETGLLASVGGLVGLLVAMPCGILIDECKAKRSLLVLSLIFAAASALTIYLFPFTWPVFAATAFMSCVDAIQPPALSALTLGLFARSQLAPRLGRNGAFRSCGSLAVAGLAAFIGWYVSQAEVFLIAPCSAVLAIVGVLLIPSGAIDHERARGGDNLEGQSSSAARVSLWLMITDHKELLLYSICCLLFHFANACLMPLVGQRLAMNNPEMATAMQSASIMVAQFVMVPTAWLVGRYANRLGRRPIFLVCWAVLPLRLALYSFSGQDWWMLTVQLLDGIGAGIFDIITPVVIADITQGTGRFNIAQGFLATMQGIGASLSPWFAGVFVDTYGYNATFFVLGGVALLAFALLALLMPETQLQPDTVSTQAGPEEAEEAPLKS